MKSANNVVTIPRWEESWDRYEDIVESMQATDSVNAPLFKLSLADSVDCQRTQYNTSNQGEYYSIAGTTAYRNNISESTIADIQDIKEETRQCMQNIERQLQEVDLTWKDVVMMQVYVANMADFGLINQIYKTFFDINPPPR
jgi:enamine deaminase RidA (YjgF/YER057c/UK114 family)